MIRILFLLSLQIFGESLSAACVEFFAGSEKLEKQGGTDDLLAYWGTLLEQQILGEVDLSLVADALAKGQLINPISEQQASVNTAALLHRNEIQEYLDTRDLSREKILQWTKQKLEGMHRTKVRREATQEDTHELTHKMVFHPIPPGKFKMWDGNKYVAVELTQNIEMMSTLVTQKHWQDLMGENPSEFKGQDHPVENISWWSAITFANNLSIKHGLKPAYDMTKMTFKGRAEDGTLDVRSGDLRIHGDIYLAEGYRLPTEAEQEYVRKNLGQANGIYYFGDNERELKDHAWFVENSDGTTHPVAELKPLTIGGNDFFDLYGNVWEWAYDSHDYGCVGGRNPSGPLWGDYRALRGGNWAWGAARCTSIYRETAIAGERSINTGFRLVRTLP